MNTTPNLQPLAVNQILDKAFRIYRGSFPTLFGIAALVYIPQGIVQLVLLSNELFQQLTSLIFLIVFNNLATIALLGGISNINLGREFTVKAVYQLALKKFFPVLGSNLLIGLAIGLPVACLAFIPMVGFIALIVVVPLAVFLGTRWSVTTSVIVLEGKGSVQGLSRSWELTKDVFWRVFGTSFLASLFSMFLTVLPSFAISFMLENQGVSFLTIQGIRTVVDQLSAMLILPFSIAVQVLIYYDLRIRKEGLDLLLRAQPEDGLQLEDGSPSL